MIQRRITRRRPPDDSAAVVAERARRLVLYAVRAAQGRELFAPEDARLFARARRAGSVAALAAALHRRAR